jgi:hypothetical protein
VKESHGVTVNHDTMKQTRLVRLLHLLTLYRRCAATLLITARDIFRSGKRGKAMKLIGEYQRIKNCIAETRATVMRMIAGIIAA